MTYTEILEAFPKCTTAREYGGRISIKCKLGLWGVDAPDRSTAFNEAISYFQLYLADGEYSDIIGGLSALDVALGRMKKNDVR